MNSLLSPTIIIISIILIYQQEKVHGETCRKKHDEFTNGNLGYCTLDSLTIGVQPDCNENIRTEKIDYTPVRNNPDGRSEWQNYVALSHKYNDINIEFRDLGSVVFANYFNNIAYKYDLIKGRTITLYELSKLPSWLDNKINDEMNLYLQCTPSDEERGRLTGYISPIKFMNELIDISSDISSSIFEQGDTFVDLDELYVDMKEYAYTEFINIINQPYTLGYELLAPSFDVFINIFSEYIKFYLSIIQAAALYDDKINNNASKQKFRDLLADSKIVMNDLKDWITDSVNDRIYNKLLDKAEILNKNCNSDISYKRDQLSLSSKHRIDRVYFMDNWGEAIASYLDIGDGDSDYLCMNIRITNANNGDKWCEYGDFECDTEVRNKEGIKSPDTSNGQFEFAKDECVTELKSKACEFQNKFKNDINEYHENLVNKYLSPIDDMINDINNIEFNLGNLILNSNIEYDDNFIKFEGLQCYASNPYLADGESNAQTEEECKQTCFDMDDCVGFVRFTSDPVMCHFRGGELDIPLINEYSEDIDCFVKRNKD